MASDQQKREQEIERLAREIGSLIREAHQTQNQEAEHPERRRAMNPMAAGIGLVVIGAGLAFIMPPVGLVLIVVGLFAIIWGVVITLFKK